MTVCAVRTWTLAPAPGTLPPSQVSGADHAPLRVGSYQVDSHVLPVLLFIPIRIDTVDSYAALAGDVVALKTAAAGTPVDPTDELAANPMATERIVHDLNADPRIPLPDDCVDDVVCCVSVDYLTRPVEVFRDVARVLRPSGRFVCTFSNRVFPGVAEVFARRCPTSALSSDDFPTLERPMNATSGSGGSRATSARGNEPTNLRARDRGRSSRSAPRCARTT